MRKINFIIIAGFLLMAKMCPVYSLKPISTNINKSIDTNKESSNIEVKIVQPKGEPYSTNVSINAPIHSIFPPNSSDKYRAVHNGCVLSPMLSFSFYQINNGDKIYFTQNVVNEKLGNRITDNKEFFKRIISKQKRTSMEEICPTMPPLPKFIPNKPQTTIPSIGPRHLALLEKEMEEMEQAEQMEEICPTVTSPSKFIPNKPSITIPSISPRHLALLGEETEKMEQVEEMEQMEEICPTVTSPSNSISTKPSITIPSISPRRLALLEEEMEEMCSTMTSPSKPISTKPKTTSPSLSPTFLALLEEEEEEEEIDVDEMTNDQMNAFVAKLVRM